MGQAVGTVGSTGVGICYNHPTPVSYTTTISSGAPAASVNGQAIATVGSMGIATCGHPTVADTGGTVMVDGQAIHRVGDTGHNGGQYTLSSGSGIATSV